MISGDLGYVGKEGLQELRKEIGGVERMLKAMIEPLENKHLNPFSQLLSCNDFILSGGSIWI
jgi:hypothetical protein